MIQVIIIEEQHGEGENSLEVNNTGYYLLHHRTGFFNHFVGVTIELYKHGSGGETRSRIVQLNVVCPFYVAPALRLKSMK